MIDNEETRNLWATAGIHFSPAAFGMEGPQPVTLAGLRAVEAAVRADQIERDAAIADAGSRIRPGEIKATYYVGRKIATAIRAQQNGDSNAE